MKDLFQFPKHLEHSNNALMGNFQFDRIFLSKFYPLGFLDSLQIQNKNDLKITPKNIPQQFPYDFHQEIKQAFL